MYSGASNTHHYSCQITINTWKVCIITGNSYFKPALLAFKVTGSRILSTTAAPSLSLSPVAAAGPWKGQLGKNAIRTMAFPYQTTLQAKNAHKMWNGQNSASESSVWGKRLDTPTLHRHSRVEPHNDACMMTANTQEEVAWSHTVHHLKAYCTYWDHSMPNSAKYRNTWLTIEQRFGELR